MSAHQAAEAMRQRLADVDTVIEATGLHPEEVEELYRIADRMIGWDGRSPMALDGSDLFGALRCLPSLLSAISPEAEQTDA